MDAKNSNADQGWDSYNERVLRNEGRLEGLERLVSETRGADAKLVAQRSDSLAKELYDTAESLRHLMAEQRDADKEEFRAELGSAKELSDSKRTETEKRFEQVLVLIREITTTSVQKNYEQSHAQIQSLEATTKDLMANIDEASRSRYANLEQRVAQWREAEREARLLQAAEYERRLTVLNGEHSRIANILSASVTRELFVATIKSIEEKAEVTQRAILTMPTNVSMDKVLEGLNARLDQSTATIGETANARMGVLEEKLADEKERRGDDKRAVETRVTKIETAVSTTKEAKGVTMSQLGLMFGAVTIVLTVIVMLSNNVFGGG